jgi:RNA polymerase primary sigma factor
MSVAKDRWEKREAFASLMEKGEYQGYITNDDIIIVFPEAEDSEERLERLQSFFRAAGVEVFEDVSQLPAHIAQDDEIEEIHPFDLSAISSDDTVGLYLKEMARVPLLTTEQRLRTGPGQSEWPLERQA